ncbi:MAG: hypothetical protein ACD_67C00039G0001, partial [uncultured bacterium]
MNFTAGPVCYLYNILGTIVQHQIKGYHQFMKITIHKIKKFFAHFFTLDDTPHNIAGGMALGVFLG